MDQGLSLGNLSRQKLGAGEEQGVVKSFKCVGGKMIREGLREREREREKERERDQNKLICSQDKEESKQTITKKTKQH